jgi:phosphate transport system substrate-binding protein
MLGRELAADRLGIAWSTMSQAKGIAGIKLLAIAPRGGGSPVKPSQASFADRSYPLVRNIYVYFDRKPGSQLKPELRGFLGFVLSREGQSLLAGSGYLPLPPRLAAEQLAKLQ